MSARTTICACVFMIYNAYSSALNAQSFNSNQIKIIKETAFAVCNTVKNAAGRRSANQIDGDVKAQLGELLGRLSGVGVEGKISTKQEIFEGLSQEATAAALNGDRQCRERIFNNMFSKLSSFTKSTPSPPKPVPRPPTPVPPRISVLGPWAGPVTCDNGQYFSLFIEFVQEFGSSTVGFSRWTGSNRGTDRATLSPNPNTQNSFNYVLISDKPSTYRYTVQIPNQNLIVGISMGNERCRLRLERV